MDKGWSINSADWEALEQVLPRSRVWNFVLLTLNDQFIVPAKPGVYAICAPPPNATDPNIHNVFQSLATPLYIGRSESNIRSRFIAHCGSSDSKLRTARQCHSSVQLRFWFVEMSASVVRDAEARLIDCFGPSVNEKRGTINGTIKPPVEA